MAILKKATMNFPPLTTPLKVALGVVVAGGLYWLFGGSASASSGSAGCNEKSYSKDEAKAIQEALNALLRAAGKPTIKVDGDPGASTCKAAAWLVANVKDCPQNIIDFANSKTCGCGKKRAPCGIGGPTAPQSVRQAIIAAGVAKGYPASDVDKAISRESGWHAQALNCQGADHHPVAGGLNGMLNSVLRANGFDGSADQFAALTAEEQLPYVLKFISKMPRSVLHEPGDFGLALFTPAYVGKPDDFVIYEVGSSGWEQNPGLREGKDGPVTAGKVRSTAR